MAPSASVEAPPSIAAISPTAIGRSGPVATGTGGALTVRVTVSVVVALATRESSVTVRVAVKVPGSA